MRVRNRIGFPIAQILGILWPVSDVSSSTSKRERTASLWTSAIPKCISSTTDGPSLHFGTHAPPRHNLATCYRWIEEKRYTSERSRGKAESLKAHRNHLTPCRAISFQRIKSFRLDSYHDLDWTEQSNYFLIEPYIVLAQRIFRQPEFIV